MRIFGRAFAICLASAFLSAIPNLTFAQTAADSGGIDTSNQPPGQAGNYRAFKPFSTDLGMTFKPWGYVRFGYELVDEDNNANQSIGDNDGFLLENARLGFDGLITEQLSLRVSLEAASQIVDDDNTPLGEIDVRLRDAYLRYDPFDFIGLQVGQFRVPFAAEELMGRENLLFASRAVAQEGVPVGRGYQREGLAFDRELGVMLSPRTPISLGAGFGLSYFLMLANGNGSNQILNDNDRLAFFGRLETRYRDILAIGGGYTMGDRRLNTENDTHAIDEETYGWSGDLLLSYANFELFGQYVRVVAEQENLPSSESAAQGFHVQLGYHFDFPFGRITPAYRFAEFDPVIIDPQRFSNEVGDSNDLRLDYHTIGLRILMAKLPLTFYVNYTITEEQQAARLQNDRLQILAQVEF